MGAIRSMFWKEWSEERAFLWIALGVFLGLPIIAGLEGLAQYSHRFEIQATPWVITCGGMLALLVGVGATCRDFEIRLENFWRSRPVSIVGWLLVKYVVGLSIVLAGCIVPLAAELAFARDKSALRLVAWFPFLWSAIYSLAFLAGCLVRRTAHAAMLGLAAMLLVYFLPMVLPPLAPLSTTSILEPWSDPESWRIPLGRAEMQFAAGWSCAALAGLAFSLLAAAREWRVESGRKMMYGAVSAAFLILFSSAAFQLGTNLPILGQVDLPEREMVAKFIWDDRGSYVLTMKWERLTQDRSGKQYVQPEYQYRTLNVSAAGIELGNPHPRNEMFASRYFGQPAVALPQDPEVLYLASEVEDGETINGELDVCQFKEPVSRSIKLWQQKRTNERYDSFPVSVIWEGRLYVIGDHLVVLDLADPLSPKVISDTPFSFRFVNQASSAANTVGSEIVLALPNVPGLPPMERLKAAIRKQWFSKFDGQVLCESIEGALVESRLKSLNDTQAVFEVAARYEPMLLERIFGRNDYSAMELQNGLLYAGGGSSAYGYRGAWVNPGLTVFDARDRLRVIGHFAAPGAGQVSCPLPDGRALIGGTKIWLVGPPPRHDR